MPEITGAEHAAFTVSDVERGSLDHFAFAVADRAALEAWEAELRLGDVSFTPIAETPIETVIVVRDSDGIQLELWLPSG